MNPKMKDKADIISCIVKHYCIYQCKAELDQLVSGLESLEVCSLFYRHPHLFLPLFAKPVGPLTSMVLQDMLEPCFPPHGSNSREREEEAAFNWVTFLSEFDNKDRLIIDRDEGGHFSLTLQDILIFVTGSFEIPPAGFQPDPSIEFTSEGVFPIASTCSNVLIIPLGLSYDAFRYKMAFGIVNSPRFLRI